MASLTQVRASNARLKDLGPGLVAVFGVGGTSGIGESTLKAFVANTVQSRAYIVGRNKAAAERIIAETKSINTSASVTFIQCDVTLLKNVDAACAAIRAKEDHVNFLVMTCGNLSFSGKREETSEHLDARMALDYYARFRFVHDLLPQLTAGPGAIGTGDGGSANNARRSAPTRVISILRAGFERPIDESDLPLEKTGAYTFLTAGVHSTILNDFAVEELARVHPGIGFVHMYPGFVETGQGSKVQGVSWIMKKVFRVVAWFAGFFATSAEEAGERVLWVATDGKFAGRKEAMGGNEAEDGTEGRERAVGSDGVMGSGAYLLSLDGSVVGKQDVITPMRERGLGAKVWEHTMEIFARVEGRGDAA